MSKEYENDIICPYCEYKFSDSWEYNDDSEKEIECLECSKNFLLCVDFDVNYSTHRIDCEKHSFKEPTFRNIEQDTCDRWNNKNFVGRSDHTPHRTWIRKCHNCEEQEYIETEVGGENPFKLSSSIV